MKVNPHASMLFGLNIFARVSDLYIQNATKKKKKKKNTQRVIRSLAARLLLAS